MASIQTLLLLCPFAFFTFVMSEQDTVCDRPILETNVEAKGLQMLFHPGSELVLSCKKGYSQFLGPRTIVCGASGAWSQTRFTCTPKHCSTPELSNGEVYHEDNIYLSTINYTCNEGYTMLGANSAVCLEHGMWSEQTPGCKPVTCGLAPIPQFGKIIYDRKLSGNTTQFGDRGTYQCLPPLALIGKARGECTASGEWTRPPICQLVTCPLPVSIENGYMSSRQMMYYYKDIIKYGCNGDYVIDGSMEIECQETGEWSKSPVCKAPCTVGLDRGRILYNGNKLWIADLNPNRVFHNDIISVYCADKTRKCGYAVPTQCIDGKLPIPECFERPSLADYNMNPSSLPSEIKQC